MEAIPEAKRVVLTPAYSGQLPEGYRIAHDEIRLRRDEKAKLFGTALKEGQEAVIETPVPGYKVTFPVTYIISEIVPPHSSIGQSTRVIVQGEREAFPGIMVEGNAAATNIATFLDHWTRKQISNLEEDIALCNESNIDPSSLERQVQELRKDYGL